MRKKISEIVESADSKWVPMRKFAGLALAVFVALALFGCFSFLFSWKQDQSVLMDDALMNAGTVVSNKGGKLGLRLASVLIGRWFGLGAFAAVFALGVLAFRLVFGKSRFSIFRIIILSLTGAVLLSFVLAYFSMVFGLENSFGGGLGGQCGAVFVHWLDNLVNVYVALLIIVLLCVVWLYFSSSRFYDWFHNAGSPAVEKDKKERKRRTFTWGETPSGGGDEESRTGETSENEEDPAAGPVEKPAEVIETEKAAPDPLPLAAKVQENVVSGPAEPEANSGIKVEAGQELSTDIMEELPRIDVRQELEAFKFWSLDLLSDYSESIHKVLNAELERNNYKIRACLTTYNIAVQEVKAKVGPTVTLYKVYPAPGVRIASIKNLYNELSISLNTKKLRIMMLDDSVGLEVPNDKPSIVPLKAMLNADAFRDSKAELPIAIGVTVTQDVKVFDLADAPHLLVAGATKQGKSVSLNVMIASLLYAKHPSELKLVFIDPKMVEFTAYSRLLHHYLAVLPDAASEDDEKDKAIVKKSAQAEIVLRSLCVEMDERYELLSKATVNNIKAYNDKYSDRHLLPTEGHRYLPYIVTIIDEYADLTMSGGTIGEGRNQARSITQSIIRLAQKGRAAGIHIILATQRPSVDVITGTIKTNFPTRIAFRVSQMQDSRTILDSPGAEKLIGNGDMLYYAGIDMERVQCAFVSNKEVIEITKAIESQKGYKKSYNTPYYLPSVSETIGSDEAPAMIDMKSLDERFEEAARMVVSTQRGSTSDLQRKLGMGYAKAGRVMDQLEAAGIVGPQEGSKPRQVLVADLDTLDSILRAYMKGE